jgi:hypothetical protein
VTQKFYKQKFSETEKEFVKTADKQLNPKNQLPIVVMLKSGCTIQTITASVKRVEKIARHKKVCLFRYPNFQKKVFGFSGLLKTHNKDRKVFSKTPKDIFRERMYLCNYVLRSSDFVGLEKQSVGTGA